MCRRQIHMLLEHLYFVTAVFVQANSPMPSTLGYSMNSGMTDIIRRQCHVLRLLGIDTEPSEMLDAIIGHASRLDLVSCR